MIGAVPDNHICHRKPSAVTYNSVFVDDLSCICCSGDLRADDNGVWIHGGEPWKRCVVEFDPESNEIISAVPEEMGTGAEPTFTLVQVYQHHTNTPTFHRRTSYLIDEHSQTVQYAVIQYM